MVNDKCKSGRRGMAILMVACMLFCTLTPVIMDWNDDFVSAEDGSGGDSKTLNYVSIGASNTNGYGIRGYMDEASISAIISAAFTGGGGAVKDNTNVYGYLRQPEGAYPDLIRDHYTKNGYDVNLAQLAISSMRVEEVRVLLDDDYEGDGYTDWRFTGGPCWFEKANAGGLEGLRSEYRQYIADADLVTIDIGWNNFGVYVSRQLQDFMEKGKCPFEIDFSNIFTDEDDLKVVDEVRGHIRELVMDHVAPETGLTDMLTTVVDVFAYSLLGYIHNFDAVMEKIHDLNPDADVVVLGIQNLMHGIVVELDGRLIPVGDMFGSIVNMANYYIAHLSPYQDMYLYVMPGVDGHVDLFLDSMRGYIEPGELDEDTLKKAPNPSKADGLTQNIKDSVDYYDNDFYIQSMVGMFVYSAAMENFPELKPYFSDPYDFIEKGRNGELDPIQPQFDAIYWAVLNSAYDTMASIVGYVADMESLNLDGLDLGNFGDVASVLETALVGELEENASGAVNAAMSGSSSPGYVVDLDKLFFNAASSMFVVNHMRTGLGNSFYAHPSELGHKQICDAVIDIIDNPEKERDQIPRGIGDLLADGVQDAMDELESYLDMFQDGPLGIGLQERYDAFMDDCEALASAMGSGDDVALKAAIDRANESFTDLRVYVEYVLDTVYGSSEFQDFRDRMISGFSELQVYFDIVDGYVLEILDSVDWESVGQRMEAIADDMLDGFKDSEYYAELCIMVDGIKVDLEQKYMALMSSVYKGIDCLEIAVAEFEAELEVAILDLKNWAQDVADDLDAGLEAVIDGAIASYEELLMTVEGFLDLMHQRLLSFVEGIQGSVEDLILIMDGAKTYLDGLQDRVSDIIREIRDVVVAMDALVDKMMLELEAVEVLVQQGMDAYDALLAIDVGGMIEDVRSSLDKIGDEAEDLLAFMNDDLVMMIELRIECMKSALSILEIEIEDKLTYDEQDKVYFYNGNGRGPLYIGGSVDPDSKYGHLSGLRLMDIVQLMGGTESDGLVEFDAVDRTAFHSDIANSSLVVLEVDSGNLRFLVNDLVFRIISEDVPSLAPADVDFSRYDALVGTSTTEWLNAFEDNAAPVVGVINQQYPGNEDVIDTVQFLVERIAYAYLGSFSAMIESEMIVHGLNPYATVLFTGAYNPLEGMIMDLDGAEIPIGDIYGSMVPVFNRFVSEYCEDVGRTVFVDLSEVETGISTYGVLGEDVVFEFFNNGYGILDPTTVGYERIADCVDSVVSGLECVQTHYYITLIDGDGRVIQKTLVEYGALPEYMGVEAPTKTKTDEYSYVFNGSWSPAFVPVSSEMTYVAQFDQIPNKYTITFDTAGGSTIEPMVLDYGAEVIAPADPVKACHVFMGWDREIPATMPAEDIILTAQWGPVPVTSVTLDREVLTMSEGDTIRLVATIVPSDATVSDVVWTSSDSSIVEVDSEGNVTAIKGGSATITVTTVDGSYSDACEVTVESEASDDTTILIIAGAAAVVVAGFAAVLLLRSRMF